MRFRNSLRLVMENFKQVFRLLFIRIIILVAAVAVCSAFVSPKWEGFVSSSQFTQFFSNVKEFSTLPFLRVGRNSATLQTP